MRNPNAYSQEVKLDHNESAAKVNSETGEVTIVKKRMNNIPEGKELFNKDAKFVKVYEKVNKFLLNILTATEYRIVSIMILKSNYLTNTLDPLNDETPITLLAEELKTSRNTIIKSLDKLRSLGIFGSFEVVESSGKSNKKWILNPFISFKGKLISTELIHLFSDTIVSKISQD